MRGLELRKTCSACGQRSHNDPCDQCYSAVRAVEERARTVRLFAETVMLDPVEVATRARQRGGN